MLRPGIKIGKGAAVVDDSATRGVSAAQTALASQLSAAAQMQAAQQLSGTGGLGMPASSSAHFAAQQQSVEQLHTQAPQQHIGTDSSQSNVQSFFLDNTVLHARSPGLGYRFMPQIQAKSPENAHAPWGSTVQGVSVNEDWVQVGEQYLPTKLNGHQVLRIVSADSVVESTQFVEVRSDNATALTIQGVTEHIQQVNNLLGGVNLDLLRATGTQGLQDAYAKHKAVLQSYLDQINQLDGNLPATKALKARVGILWQRVAAFNDKLEEIKMSIVGGH